MDEFAAIIDTAAAHHLRITLLGYKIAGRGNQFKPHDYSNWMNVVELAKKNCSINLGIDTVLAAQESMKKVPHVLYSTQEGKIFDVCRCSGGKSRSIIVLQSIGRETA
jgi:hypothetical protein